MCGLEIYISKDDFVCNNNCKHRGPDSTKQIDIKYFDYNISLIFHRLSIIDLEHGEQPFIYETEDETIYLLCNGEIYNYKDLIKKYNLNTESDCKVILEMFKIKNTNIYDIIPELDGEFAFVLLVLKKKYDDISVFYGRDRFGIRPLFHKIAKNSLFIASELKGLPNMDGEQVEPRKIYFSDLDNKSQYIKNYYHIGTQIEYNSNIKDILIESVRDRMQTERPLGALLSGGLDSSLICGIASRILSETGQRLNTFTIGMDIDSPDIEYARKVAKHINSIHHEIIIPVDVWLDNLKNVIRQIETYDITTIRASCGQYLISKWISENTDIKVILNGDGSDEVTSGYLYFYNAPDENSSHLENLNLLTQIHNYDVLRVDRGISAFGLESRVPFLSHKFVDTYLSIDKNLRNPLKLSNKSHKRIEKYELRNAFDNSNIIPEDVLWRVKEAFSDGVSSQKKSWFEYIEEYVAKQVTNEEFIENNKDNKFPSKEAYWYYSIYKQFYPNSELKVTYWMPKWSDEHKGDPSARKLKTIY